MPVENGLSVRTRLNARRPVGVTPDAEVSRSDHAKSRLARKKFHARFLGSEARRQARCTARSVSRVLEFLLREKVFQVVGRFVPEQSLHAADLDRIDSAASRMRNVGLHPPDIAVLARTTSATFIPANPRQSTSAMSLRGFCGADEIGKGLRLGSSVLRVGIPGTICWRRAVKASARSMTPEAAIKWP